jgi:NAD(P)-dependent dehydrogenase (short-subunit alcohol dehydrogenase family)
MLVLMEEQTFEGWHDILFTNTVGALSLITAAIPQLAPDGLIAYISSDSVGYPYHGLIPDGVSKAGLDEGVRGLRMEYPNVRFTRVAVGTTTGTETGFGMDPELSGRLLPEWLRNARVWERQMEASDLGELIVECLAPALLHPDTEIEEMLIRPPGGAVPWDTDIEVLRAYSTKFQPEDPSMSVPLTRTCSARAPS